MNRDYLVNWIFPYKKNNRKDFSYLQKNDFEKKSFDLTESNYEKDSNDFSEENNESDEYSYIEINERLYDENEVNSFWDDIQIPKYNNEYHERKEKQEYNDDLESDQYNQDIKVTSDTLLDIALCQHIQPILCKEEVFDKAIINDNDISKILKEDELVRKYIKISIRFIKIIDSFINRENKCKEIEDDKLLVERFISDYDEIWKNIKTSYYSTSDSNTHYQIDINPSIMEGIDIQIDDLSEKYNFFSDNDTFRKLINRIYTFRHGNWISKPIELYEELAKSVDGEDYYNSKRDLVKCLSLYRYYDYSETKHLCLLALNEEYLENYLKPTRNVIVSDIQMYVASYLANSPKDTICFKAYNSFNIMHKTHAVSSIRHVVNNIEKHKYSRRFSDHKKHGSRYNGCFGIMEYGPHKYYAFSGVYDTKDQAIINRISTLTPNQKAVNDQLDDLENNIILNGVLRHFKRARCTLDVKNYEMDSYGHVKSYDLKSILYRSDFNNVKGQFSCCERKMFAEFEKDIIYSNTPKVQGYVFTKFKACNICKLAISDVNQKHCIIPFYSHNGAIKKQ